MNEDSQNLIHSLELAKMWGEKCHGERAWVWSAGSNLSCSTVVSIIWTFRQENKYVFNVHTALYCTLP